MNKIKGGVCAPRGFTASGVHCGIRKNRTKSDLALIYSDTICTAASVYTQNKVKGSPILVTKKNIADGKAQAILCNSGNANTCNADGVEKAEKMCSLLAAELGICASDVVVASTGVIGQTLPIEPIATGMSNLVASLSVEGGSDAAAAIMTTDLKAKEVAVSFTIDGVVCHMGAIAKGSGMIHPNMATMLVFVTSDVSISSEMLQKAVSLVVDDTFNMVSVDGDTSTNDMLSVLANGKAGNGCIDSVGDDFDIFTAALMEVSTYLCREIAADAEGASRLITCNIVGSDTVKTAKSVAKSIVTSSLVKTAVFGADANWGRILCAIGYAEGDFDINKVSVWFKSCFGEILVCKNGYGVPFDEELAKNILVQSEIIIHVDLGLGGCCATAWGCDLTYDYVKINGDYRT